MNTIITAQEETSKDSTVRTVCTGTRKRWFTSVGIWHKWKNTV